tara:strand:+ start:220 stop:447 length:228 start_codon:yes stop_codon:yes gene_type:complete
MKTRGNYTVDQDHYNLTVSYEYYWDDGDYENPPEDDFEILEVDLNGVDITDFFWDWVTDDLKGIVYQYAQQNKFN